MIGRIHARKGAEGSALRALRNNLAFVVADEGRKEEMRRKAVRRLALQALKKPERLVDLAEHQQAKIRELEARSEQELAIAIQQCYRHVFYPSRDDRVGAGNAESRPFGDPTCIRRRIDPARANGRSFGRWRDLRKLRLVEDEPDSPAYVRDRTPLKKGQMTTLALRGEFRRDPALPILVGDDIFIRGVRRGIEQGDYVYRARRSVVRSGRSARRDRHRRAVPGVHDGLREECRHLPRKTNESADPEPGDGKPDRPSETDEDGSAWDNGHEAGWRPSNRRDARLVYRRGYARGGAGPDLGTGPDEGRRGHRGVDRPHVRGGRCVPGFSAPSAPYRERRRSSPSRGGYETREGGSFQLEFRGPVPDAQPVREFLEPQLRDAGSRNLEAGFELTFEDGLSMRGDAAEKLTERLARFASGRLTSPRRAEAKS